MFVRASALPVMAMLLLSGCVVMPQSEVSRMQRDIREMKTDLENLSQTVKSNDSRFYYQLTSIQEKMNIPQDVLQNVNTKLDSVSRSVENLRQTPPPSNTGAGASNSGNAAAAADAGGAADQLYHQAEQTWSDNNVEQARRLFEAFAQQFPKDPRASEALYKIGDSYYKSQKKDDFAKALPYYQQVLKDYPGSLKEADAAAKIGYCYLGMSENDKAKESLQKVLERYPNYYDIERVKSILSRMKNAE